MIYVKFFLLLCCLKDIIGQFGNPLNKYIRHYEGLSYDTETLHSRHQRAKRALHPEDRTVHLDFHAHGRKCFIFFELPHPVGSQTSWSPSGPWSPEAITHFI
ncbi:Disintegrin and metalloproteinase domain-containing protein 10 [Ameca splendens]|uniref:Disintegrin and metalloproteinase domain-containing protein 10 n=1 Tax=Ameca splendens TaxID=208324 RepID=A0ABV0YAL0_9TELE